MEKNIKSGYWNQYREENQAKEDAVKESVDKAMETLLAVVGGCLAGIVITLIAFTF